MKIIRFISALVLIILAIPAYSATSDVFFTGYPQSPLVPVNGTSTLTYTVENRASQPAPITSYNFTPSSNYTYQNPASFSNNCPGGSVPANQTASCQVFVTLTGVNTGAVNNAQFYIYYGQGTTYGLSKGITITVGGSVLPSITYSIQPQKSKYAIKPSSNNVVVEYTITNEAGSGGHLTLSGATFTPSTNLTATPDSTDTNCGSSLTPGNSCIYAANVTSTSSIQGSGTVSIALNNPNGTLDSTSVTSTTVYFTPIAVKPELATGSVSSSSISSGQTTTITYTLTSGTLPVVLTGAPSVSLLSNSTAVKLSAPSSNDNCPLVSGAKLAANSQCAYTVTAQGLKQGSATVVLTVPYQGGQTLTANSALITITRAGLIWTVTAEAPSPNNPVTSGAPVTVVFDVTNDGLTTLTLSNPTPSSNQAASFWSVPPALTQDNLVNPCGNTLNAGDTCQYAVVATSTATASNSNVRLQLKVHSNAKPQTLAAQSTAINMMPASSSTGPATITNLENPPSPLHIIPNATTSLNYNFTNTSTTESLTIQSVVLTPQIAGFTLTNANKDGFWCDNICDVNSSCPTNTTPPQGTPGESSICALNLTAAPPLNKPGVYKAQVQVNYTDPAGNPYSVLGNSVTYEVYKKPTTPARLTFTQQPSAVSMDLINSTGQTLVYQVLNSSKSALYIEPQFLLNAMNKDQGANSSGALYPKGAMSLSCSYTCQGTDCPSSPPLEGKVSGGKTCNITVTLPSPAEQGIKNTSLYDQWLSIPYAVDPAFSSKEGELNFPITFQVTDMSDARVATFVNNCKAPVYLAISSATAANTSSSDPQNPTVACKSNNDCSPGTHCVATSAGGTGGQCYFLNPVPSQTQMTNINQNSSNNPYYLTSGSTANVVIPQQQNMPASMLNIIANMTIAGRVDCHSPSGAGTLECQSSDCSDSQNNMGGGNFIPGWGCAPSASIAPPGTKGELNYANGNSGSVDYYDVSLVNGYTIPMTIAPSDVNLASRSKFSCLSQQGDPYYCGTAGSTEQQSSTTSDGIVTNTIGVSTWTFNWLNKQSTSGFNFQETDLPYLTIVTNGGFTCSTSNVCTKDGDVCGASMKSMRALANGTSVAEPALTCGKFLGYWAPGQACTSSGNNAGRPYYCSTSITNVGSSAPTSSTLSELYQCNDNVKDSGYNTFSEGTQSCGCVNWGGSTDDRNSSNSSALLPPQNNPFGNMSTVPVAGMPGLSDYPVQYCNTYNTGWLYGTSQGSTASNPASTATTAYPFLFYSVFKQGSPSAYTYQYDDPSSTFKGSSIPPTSGNKLKNLVNYTVTFCPGDTNMVASGANPDSVSALQVQKNQDAAVQAAKAKIARAKQKSED